MEEEKNSADKDNKRGRNEGDEFRESEKLDLKVEKRLVLEGIEKDEKVSFEENLEEISEHIEEERNDLPENNETELKIICKNSPWTCFVCKDLFIDPVESNCCNELFCEKCVRNTTDCPKCNTYTSWSICIPIRKIMDEMLIQCQHSPCSQFFKRKNLSKHENQCELAVVQCKNSELCIRMLRKDLELHLLDCKYRLIKCTSNCGGLIAFCELENHLKNDCPREIAKCPNFCGEEMLRSELNLHINHYCPMTIVVCMLSSEEFESCGHKCNRCEMAEHQVSCIFRKVNCKNVGCSELIVFKNIEKHEEICNFKVISCKNACGTETMRKCMEEHYTKCELEVVNCGYFVVGCEDRMQRKSANQHLIAKALEHSEMMIVGVTEASLRVENFAFSLQTTKEKFFKELNDLKQKLRINPSPILYDSDIFFR
jgi:hypothetical protein